MICALAAGLSIDGGNRLRAGTTAVSRKNLGVIVGQHIEDRHSTDERNYRYPDHRAQTCCGHVHEIGRDFGAGVDQP